MSCPVLLFLHRKSRFHKSVQTVSSIALAILVVIFKMLEGFFKTYLRQKIFLKIIDVFENKNAQYYNYNLKYCTSIYILIKI